MRSTFNFTGESHVLDYSSRSTAPGNFAELSAGYTHYERAGSKNGHPVILIHGFSIPYYIWDPTFAALSASGFQVVRYDLFGRGYSDRPDREYDRELFDEQLHDLIDALNIQEPVHLVGLSMGGPISIVYCDRHPEKVEKLCLIDPAGFPGKTTTITKLLKIPRLGEWIINQFGEALIIKELTKDFSNPENFPAYMDRARDQMRYKGYKQALLSTIRNDMLNNSSEVYGRVGTRNIPTLLIWGKEDKLLPIHMSEVVLKAIPHAQFFPVDHVGHLPHYEAPNMVNSRIIDFLID
jgi:pimeloyl-ACP methyl ester carboxylesterase